LQGQNAEEQIAVSGSYRVTCARRNRRLINIPTGIPTAPSKLRIADCGFRS
jgi:hypothetical protein